MNADPQEILNLVIVASVFVLVLAAWIMVMLVVAMRRSARSGRIESRLKLSEPQAEGGRQLSLWLEDREVTTTVVRKPRWRSPLKRLDDLLSEAGWDLPASAVGLGLFGVALLSEILLFLLTGNVLPGLGLAGAICAGFWFFLNFHVSRRRQTYELQFMDALDLAARSLKAGHPLLGSFRLITEEIPPPVSNTFAEICGQHSLGLTIEDALAQVADKSASEDLKLFSTSVIIQRRSGGNLAEMMENLAEVIRERMRLNRRVRVLTAQTQFSKRVLLVLPIFIFFLLNFLGAEYMSPLYTTRQGHYMLAIGALQLLMGTWVMNRMVRTVG